MHIFIFWDCNLIIFLPSLFSLQTFQNICHHSPSNSWPLFSQIDIAWLCMYVICKNMYVYSFILSPFVYFKAHPIFKKTIMRFHHLYQCLWKNSQACFNTYNWFNMDQIWLLSDEVRNASHEAYLSVFSSASFIQNFEGKHYWKTRENIRSCIKCKAV